MQVGLPFGQRKSLLIGPSVSDVDCVRSSVTSKDAPAWHSLDPGRIWNSSFGRWASYTLESRPQ
jgi:hypothetical protein